MPPQTLESRVERLEQRVNRLEELPDRMTALESQVLQLRSEMREEFSTTRQEVQAGDAETRRVLLADLGSQMRVLHEDVIGRIALLGEARPAKRKSPRR